MRLLITRPEEDGGALAEKLAERGHQPVLLPLLEIAFTEHGPLALDGVQALIATSRNALRALRRNAAFSQARALAVYAVGAATAAYAAELGFADVRVGAGTAADLAALVPATARPEAGALLYLTGEHVAFDLAAPLSDLGFEVRRAVLYEARENPAAGQALSRALAAGLDGAILMSPRTARILAALLAGVAHAHIRGLTCYCYSQAVAKSLETIPGLRLSVCPRPTEADLMTIIGDAAISRAKSDHSDELLGKS
jgi:uroporphyrinogen-III synthase